LTYFALYIKIRAYVYVRYLFEVQKRLKTTNNGLEINV